MTAFKSLFECHRNVEKTKQEEPFSDNSVEAITDVEAKTMKTMLSQAIGVSSSLATKYRAAFGQKISYDRQSFWPKLLDVEELMEGDTFHDYLELFHQNIEAYKAAAVYRAWRARGARHAWHAHDGPQRKEAGLKAASEDDKRKAASALEAVERELARQNPPAPTKESAKQAFLDVWSAELSFIGLAKNFDLALQG